MNTLARSFPAKGLLILDIESLVRVSLKALRFFLNGLFNTQYHLIPFPNPSLYECQRDPFSLFLLAFWGHLEEEPASPLGLQKLVIIFQKPQKVEGHSSTFASTTRRITNRFNVHHRTQFSHKALGHVNAMVDKFRVCRRNSNTTNLT